MASAGEDLESFLEASFEKPIVRLDREDLKTFIELARMEGVTLLDWHTRGQPGAGHPQRRAPRAGRSRARRLRAVPDGQALVLARLVPVWDPERDRLPRQLHEPAPAHPLTAVADAGARPPVPPDAALQPDVPALLLELVARARRGAAARRPRRRAGRGPRGGLRRGQPVRRRAAA